MLIELHTNVFQAGKCVVDNRVLFNCFHLPHTYFLISNPSFTFSFRPLIDVTRSGRNISFSNFAPLLFSSILLAPKTLSSHFLSKNHRLNSSLKSLYCNNGDLLSEHRSSLSDLRDHDIRLRRKLARRYGRPYRRNGEWISFRHPTYRSSCPPPTSLHVEDGTRLDLRYHPPQPQSESIYKISTAKQH